MRQNMATPCSVRKQPETFCCTLIMRRSLSAWLLSKGTAKSCRNRSTAHFPQRVNPTDCAPGFAWLVLVFASPVPTSSVVREEDWRGSLLQEFAQDYFLRSELFEFFILRHASTVANYAMILQLHSPTEWLRNNYYIACCIIFRRIKIMCPFHSIA